MELRDIIKEPVCIGYEQTFADAVRKMIKERANALIVVDEEGKFAGEIHVADLFEAIIPEHLDGDTVSTYFDSEEKFVAAVRAAEDTPVELFASHDVEPVHVTDSIMSVAAAAIAHQHTRIPVVDHEDRPIGVISRQGLKQIIHSYLTR